MEAERLAELELNRSTYGDDRARNELVLADIEARRGALQSSRSRLDRASQWVLNSGSQEHVCLMQLVRSRVEALHEAFEAAANAADEGLLISREAGFTIFTIELLNQRAKLAVRSGKMQPAAALAHEAQSLAQAPECRFAHGESEALQILAETGAHA